MNIFSELVVIIATTIITIPIIGLFVVYLVAVKASNNKPLSLKLAVDSTAILFIIAVYFIILEIWTINFSLIIILFILSTAIAFTFLHWRKYEDIHIQKVLKGVWRFQFFVFFCLYFLLMFYGLIRQMFIFG
ncbi:DUF3397 domain-containing protein [Evansella sp. AB-P1]|uniref:DUF3397 domain-containing protein n=1 Tax=Evansella sp. AB-P1 TaxID=3037653 RepID=UPI00241CD94B|nr:DUF3397 domain-containing protein [Evansella sp. AB-P1]MDG5788299.1 DUF3397 domain-containing protein [Evansella sp. AB-P1]